MPTRNRVAKNPDFYKSYEEKYQLAKREAAQLGRFKPKECEACGRKGTTRRYRICLDHDNATGKFRGWICNPCNMSVGYSDEAPETLRKLADYLESVIAKQKVK